MTAAAATIARVLSERGYDEEITDRPAGRQSDRPTKPDARTGSWLVT